MRKYILGLVISLAIASCKEGSPSMVRYQFLHKKNTVEKNLLKVISSETDSLPGKWKPYYKKFDFRDDTYIYFKELPEEIYRIGFSRFGENGWEKDGFSRLSLYMWYDGEGWKTNYEITDSERERIVKRFEDEILSKMEIKYEDKDLRDSWWH